MGLGFVFKGLGLGVLGLGFRALRFGFCFNAMSFSLRPRVGLCARLAQNEIQGFRGLGLRVSNFRVFVV